MLATEPTYRFTDPILIHEFQRTSGEIAADTALMAILQCGHPILTIKHALAHFARLSLR